MNTNKIEKFEHESGFTTLDCVSAKCPAIIARIQSSDPAFLSRLNALGIVDGVQVTVLQAAPFGGPVSVRVQGSTVSLRRSEANQIGVTTYI